MKTLTCDICGNAIENPVSTRNYFHVAHRDICESCHDKIEFMVKPIVRTKSPFNYEWFEKLYQESIERSIQKGKVDVRLAT
jgi:ATP sulfurylase